jgi:glycosyltransferase involved in cell wall biosynthesis
LLTKAANELRVLHVTPYFKPARSYGGPAETVYRLCLNLARAGCDVRVLTTNSDGIGRSLEVKTGRPLPMAAGFEVSYLRRLARHSIAPAMLSALLPRVWRADVVHLTGVYSFPAIPTLMAARLLHKPLVWSPRGALQRWSGSRRVALKRLWELGCGSLTSGRTVLHVTSEGERIESQRRFRRLATALIPNGVRIPREPVSLREDGMLHLGFLGRLDTKKGLENILEACARLMARGLSFDLTVAGGGPEGYVRKLRERADKTGAPVRFIGEVHDRPKRAFFESINLLAVPSHTENFAMVVAEALAAGIPVIASRGTPWAGLEDHGCGLWVDNSPEPLAEAILRMREAPLAAMGLRGRQWMAADFSWNAAARAMCTLYGSLVYGGSRVKIEQQLAIAAAAASNPSRSRSTV